MKIKKNREGEEVKEKN